MKKKSIFGLFVVSLFATAIVTSCDNTQDGIGDTLGETGSVNISFNFKSSTGAATKAVGDAKVPTTDWSTDIQSLAVLFANNSGTIEWVNEIRDQLSTSNSTATATLSNIPEGTYTMHVVANYRQSDTQAQTYGYGGIPGTAINISSYLNSNINTLLLDLTTEAWSESYNFETSVSNTYTAAPNYFAGNTTVTISSTSTASATVDLARVVSLVRVKVNNDGTGAATENANISFTETGAAVMLRRLNVSYNVSDGSYTAGNPLDQSVYFKKGFLSSEPSTGYTGTEAVLSTNFKVYQDALLFPSVDTTSSQQLNVVVVGVVQGNNTYVPAGKSEYAEDGDLVYWAGNITTELEANNVMVVNLTLTTIGKSVDDGIEDPRTYGDIAVEFELIDWADLITVDMNL